MNSIEEIDAEIKNIYMQFFSTSIACVLHVSNTATVHVIFFLLGVHILYMSSSQHCKKAY